MVHGVPTSFDITDDRKVISLQFENSSVLESSESIRWANTNSIALKKPFSSLFISLGDQEAANEAIFNNIIYQQEIRTTEHSKKHPGSVQCFKCLGFATVR